jgi:hypothetical protein
VNPAKLGMVAKLQSLAKLESDGLTSRTTRFSIRFLRHSEIEPE